MTEVRHPICDWYGQRLRVVPHAWPPLRWNERCPADSFQGLKQLAVDTGLARLYVRAPDTGEPVELRQYVAGLPPSSYRVEGPSLQLVVTFPRPRFTAVERESESDIVRAWTARLQELPVQHAVLRVANGPVGVIRVTDVPSPAVDWRERRRFEAASSAVNGQAAAEIAATLKWREDEIEHRCGGSTAPASGQDGRPAVRPRAGREDTPSRPPRQADRGRERKRDFPASSTATHPSNQSLPTDLATAGPMEEDDGSID